MEIKIGRETISKYSKPYFIADIAANHDGDLNRAYKLIELAKEAGADAAKFQNFKANTIVSRNGFDSMKGKSTHQASWSKSVYEVYQDASVLDEWTEKLKSKCDEFEIEYMTSPYDYESVDWAENYLNAYKIGSGDITWIEMLEYIAKKNKPVILATGASNLVDVRRAVRAIQKHNDQLILMQCNTNYTASKDNMKYINLNVLKTYNDLFPECILGLSDHTLGHTTVLGALALGATVFEKHFTDDNNRTGPDHKFAMNPITWREMVDCSKELYYALGDGIKKIEENEKESVIVQQRAVYTRMHLNEGDIITNEMIYPLRPIKENAILPYDIGKLIGKKVNKNILPDRCLTWEDIDND